jgi:hypothetical protein
MRRIIGLLGVNSLFGALGAATLLAGGAAVIANAFLGFPRYAQVLLLIGVACFLFLAVWNWRRLRDAVGGLLRPPPAAPSQSVSLVHQEPHSSFGGTLTATGNVFMQTTATTPTSKPRIQRSPAHLLEHAERLDTLATELDRFTAGREDGEPKYPTGNYDTGAKDAYLGQTEAYTAETHRLYMAQSHPQLLAAYERAAELGVSDDQLRVTLSVVAHSGNLYSLREAAPRLRVVAIRLRGSATRRGHGLLARLRHH